MSFDLTKLAQVLKVKVTDQTLFETALTHRSYLNENSGYKNPSNERLEFLGDAVLQHLSSEFLFNKYPQEAEGVLTNYRSAIVNTKSLAMEAKRLGLGELLHLSVGEEASGGRAREYILANTFESVLGALYLEKGMEVCKDFTTRELFYKVDTIVKTESYKDAKSKFQELAQSKRNTTPAYQVLDSWGNDHAKTFKIGAYLGKELFGEGEGSSKQKAEQVAAANALDKLRGV